MVKAKTHNIMIKIGIIVPYFGKLPNNFQIWLNSCERNSDVNWMVFTNDTSPFRCPSNVAIHRMGFDQMKNKIGQLFDFHPNIDLPYKLTDYKPAFGEIFQEYLKEYDFWGYCDIDLIFGKIRNFITDELLNQYDKILSSGHLTLFRNTDEINKLYKRSLRGSEPYKKVFTQPDFFHFDEWGKNGINEIAMAYDISMYHNIVFHDVYHKRLSFFPAQLMNKQGYESNNIYLWDKGTLWRYFISQTNELAREEILYAHFQRRKMEIEQPLHNSERLLMIPNRYLSWSGELDEQRLLAFLKKPPFFLDLLKFYYFHLKRKLKK